MQAIKNAPSSLKERYKSWFLGDFPKLESDFKMLVDEGQHPDAMIISCSDSRVNPEAIFKTKPGDFFVYRAVANFVPHKNVGAASLSIEAALEFAITALKVKRIIVMGHSHCGGVKGCHGLCNTPFDEDNAPQSAVVDWVSYIRPAYDAVKGLPNEDQLEAMEKAAVCLSLENILSYSWVLDALNAHQIELHGFWYDIRAGKLEALDPKTGSFHLIS